MSTELVQMSILVVAIWALVLLLNVLLHRRATMVQPPPRPEWLREQFARKPLTGPLAYGVLAMFVLPLVVLGVLLIAVADATGGRMLGAGLAAWALGQLSVGIWRGRPGQRKRYQERLLAHSEAFWSRPDAEEWATRLRGGSPFSRNR